MNVELEAMYARMADKIQLQPRVRTRPPCSRTERLAMMDDWTATVKLAKRWRRSRETAHDFLHKLLAAGLVERRKVKGRYISVEWKRKEEKPQ